jgi:hypothetical protein
MSDTDDKDAPGPRVQLLRPVTVNPADDLKTQIAASNDRAALFKLDRQHAQFLRRLYAELWRRKSSPPADDASDVRSPDPHDGFDSTTLDLNAIHDLITRLEDVRDRWREEIEAAMEEAEAEQQLPGLFDREGDDHE